MKASNLTVEQQESIVRFGHPNAVFRGGRWVLPEAAQAAIKKGDFVEDARPQYAVRGHVTSVDDGVAEIKTLTGREVRHVRTLRLVPRATMRWRK